ncbi:hypothetical protein HMPREF9374_3661 [Desmospora sp. 8437]|nr:hypothetical protein HMPREF9374_3661 [Desmospora sp. 8437]
MDIRSSHKIYYTKAEAAGQRENCTVTHNIKQPGFRTSPSKEGLEIPVVYDRDNWVTF